MRKNDQTPSGASSDERRWPRPGFVVLVTETGSLPPPRRFPMTTLAAWIAEDEAALRHLQAEVELPKR